MLLLSHIFHEEETGATVDGNVITINSEYLYKDMIITIDVETDATSLTLNFEAQGENNNWISYSCFNLSDNTIETGSTNATNELWQTDLVGIEKFRVRISAQSGATLGTTIKGRVIA